MFQLSKEELEKLGAEITTREIHQEPELWEELLASFTAQEKAIKEFISQINGRVRVIFTGAGTSQYVGDTLVPYLNQKADTNRFIFHSYATTDIVASPLDYLFPDEPTLLVSFARSGNSPESIAAVKLANQLVKDCYHLAITCAKEGQLAQLCQKDEHSYVFLMPERSNDAGFAMTGSFSCMYLATLLLFDQTALEEKQDYVHQAEVMANQVYDNEATLQAIVDQPFERIIYLGSGCLAGLTREAQLKVLELTAGKIATVFDSSMGFRHGPKSFINEKALVFGFVNNQPYTRQYDVDILNETYRDGIAKQVTALTQENDLNYEGQSFVFDSKVVLPSGYLVLPYIVFAQTIALLTSVKIGNSPDTPSPTGTVNRVVKGVTIHEYQA